MTIKEALERIEQEAERAQELARENGEQTVSGAYDAGRAQGLRSAAELVAKLEA